MPGLFGFLAALSLLSQSLLRLGLSAAESCKPQQLLTGGHARRAAFELPSSHIQAERVSVTCSVRICAISLRWANDAHPSQPQFTLFFH